MIVKVKEPQAAGNRAARAPAYPVHSTSTSPPTSRRPRSSTKSGASPRCSAATGGPSEGDFHEAVNLAAVWKLPVIFVIENNQYGLSTPVSEQYACARLSDRGVGYGMAAETVDGNDLLPSSRPSGRQASVHAPARDRRCWSS